MPLFQRLRFLKNFYWATGLGLLLWLLVFDQNDLVSQAKNAWEVAELEKTRDYYKLRIGQARVEYREVMGSPELLEKFAREKYLMKKPNETVFVLVDENDAPVEK